MFHKAASTPENEAFNARIGGVASLSSSEGLGSFQAAESQKWGRVIRAAGIEPE